MEPTEPVNLVVGKVTNGHVLELFHHVKIVYVENCLDFSAV